MNRIKILLAVIIIAVLAIFVAPFLVAPILEKRITTALNEKYTDFSFAIEKVHWSLIPSSLRLINVTITSKTDSAGAKYLKGEIENVRFKGIKLAKAVFNNKYEIDEIILSNSRFEGNMPFKDKKRLPTVSTQNISIGNLLFDQINLAITDSSSAHTFTIKEGALKINDLHIKEGDTLGFIHHFDFKAEQLVSVSDDSMYTFRVNNISYSDTLKTLSVEALSIIPNYKGYDFTSKFPYETDCIEADFTNVALHHFSASDYFELGNMVSSYLSIGNLDISVFRDKRKKDSNKEKPVFQEYIYSYPGLLHIDSIEFNDGNITYTEHAEKAPEPGIVTMNQLKAIIYSVSNDTIYKTKEAFVRMEAEALLMGKSKMTVSLKARLFDPVNTFSMKGTLAPMEVKELNPILGKNAFIYANSAKINKVSFNFIANDAKANGEMIILYSGLEIDVKNKRTNDNTGFNEQLISFIANKGAYDSNPLPSEEVRVGIIDFERDPSKFVFNYCLKAIVTGVKSSVIKPPLRKKTFLQRIFSGSYKKQKDTSNN